MSSGRIQTVLGTISPKDAGITLTHEHVCMQFYCALTPAPPHMKDKASGDLSFKMGNLGLIRQYPYANLENLKLFEEKEAVLSEMKYFKENGGATIVENTTIGIDRDMKFMQELSRKTGVNIVSGTGYYVGASQQASVASMTIEQMSEVMMSDLTQGADGTDIKCGVIGEIGCTWPLEASEIKCLQGAAAIQEAIGCPVIIHPGRNPKAPFEILRIVQEAGGDVSKTVMSHLDRSIHDYGELEEFAKMGSYCEYDLFGLEASHYQKNLAIDMPSDAERINRIKHLIKQGYEDKIVIAHDIHTKHRLMKFGGHGYSHILESIVPKMLARGYTQQQVDKILIHNPREWLTYNCS
ncbi:phosphotriesterase-related protein-like [Lineus longissimus]|uniref:phosphotriesterase-related protein-like n=1 Tax=Lineus longissimus TaxID=88925 RepID=UPI002B4C3316